MWGALALGGLGALSSGLASQSMGKASRHALKRSQKWQKNMYIRQLNDAQKYYEKYAFPNAGAIQAEQQGAYNQLGQAYKGLPDKVFSQSASRGFGPGSGLTMKSLGDVQGSYLQSLGQMLTNLAKFKNTPQWNFAMPGMPSAPNVQPTAGAGGMQAGLGDLFSTAAGFGLMKNMLGGGQASNPYDWFSSLLPATSQSGGPYGFNTFGQGGYGF